MGKNSTDFLSHPGQGYVKKRGVCPAFFYGVQISSAYMRGIFLFSGLLVFTQTTPAAIITHENCIFVGGLCRHPSAEGNFTLRQVYKPVYPIGGCALRQYINDVRAIMLEIWLLKQKIPHMVGFYR